MCVWASNVGEQQRLRASKLLSATRTESYIITGDIDILVQGD